MPALPEKFLTEIAKKYELSPEQAEVFIKRFGSQKNEQAIAQELHISRNALRTRMTGVYNKFSIRGKGPGKFHKLRDLLINWFEEYQKSNPSTILDTQQTNIGGENLKPLVASSDSSGTASRGHRNVPENIFEYITIYKDDPYWSESDKPTEKKYPFNRLCAQYFYLDKNKLVENAEPLFDITIINAADTYVLLTEVGIEIVSVSHLMYSYGVPEVCEVKIQGSYEVEIPDIKSRLGRSYITQNYPEPSDVLDLNEVVLMRMPSPFYLESKAPFRYTLLLKKYQKHMPNNAILRFWARTSKGTCRSHEIHLFTC